VNRFVAAMDRCIECRVLDVDPIFILLGMSLVNVRIARYAECVGIVIESGVCISSIGYCYAKVSNGFGYRMTLA
jgi:hypothetical protein